MFSLPPDLDQLCSQLFNRCQEFESGRRLRTLFANADLRPFADRLPESPGSQSDFVSAVKAFLLEKKLADGRPLILPFLQTLRDQYNEADSLHGDLDDLYWRVHQHLLPERV